MHRDSRIPLTLANAYLGLEGVECRSKARWELVASEGSS